MAVAAKKPEMVGTVWTASASLMDGSGNVIGRCIDTPNAIAKALMEMPQAKSVKGLEGTHDRKHWESRMMPWNTAKSGLVGTAPKPKGELIAKFTERKMAPSTGQDTDYVYEWRLVGKPDDAGREWKGQPWGVERTFTKGGIVQDTDLMRTGDTKQEAVKGLSGYWPYDKAEKYGLAKAEDQRLQKERETKETAKKVEEEQERQDRGRYEQRMKELGTRKGVKEGTISIDAVGTDYKTHTRKDVPGFIIGNGIGVAISGEGRYKDYTVTHLNTGKAMGHGWDKPKEAIALAKAVAELGDWAKYKEEQDVPKSMMTDAAALVRGFTGKWLKPEQVKTPSKVQTPKPIPKPTPEAKEPWKMTRKEFQAGKLRYLGPGSVARGERPAGVASSRQQEEIEQVKKLGLATVKLDDGQVVYGKTKADADKLADALRRGVKDPELSRLLGYSEADREALSRYGYEPHKQAIAKALSEGKPVPAEVLKDYPELGKKEEPSSQFQVTHRDASGVADVLKAKNGEIIGRIGRGEKKGWWEAVVGGTWFTAKTPERVLELATKRRNEEPFKGKEGWQIPRGDWMKAESAGKKVPWPSGVAGEPTGGVGRMMDPHYAMVERAVEAGKPVPANVLKSYPELMKQAKPEPKAEGKGKEVTPQGKVRYHIEPDGVIKAREIGGTGRTLASWRPGNRPDSTTKNDAGSIWHDDKVYINKADWDKAVRQKLDLDTSHFVADSWRGGGMIHKGNLIKEQEKPSASVKPKSAKSHPKYEGTKRLEPKPRKEIAALKPKPATKQSDRAIAIDRALLAKQVVSVDDPRWLRQPNRFDVRGIDTPGSGRVVSRTGFADKGKTRMSRKHHRGWKRIKL